MDTDAQEIMLWIDDSHSLVATLERSSDDSMDSDYHRADLHLTSDTLEITIIRLSRNSLKKFALFLNEFADILNGEED